MSNREFFHEFSKVLSYEGDMFFTSGSLSTDVKNIKQTISHQGYWAGTRVRYYFDDNFKFLRTEERKFGA